ncbi:universal stress protein [Streptomyces sp. S3(2020)]|uniref:universal stress protein n=1 Tax=Streptomyces sp. S3(2020) TaxID=2732044 RepID=UPI003216B16D
MSVIVWLVEVTWSACVDAARRHAPEDTEIVLLHVSGHEIPEAACSAFTGPLGLGEPEHVSATRLDTPATSGGHLLESAADRLGRPCTRMQRTGHIAREVIVAAQGAQLLIMARDGDRSRLGPDSLGPAGRFVVDHAP